MKILFTGGGSAGHVLPIVAICREIRRLGFKSEFFYIGPRDEFGSFLLSQEEIKLKKILAGKIRRYLSCKAIIQNIVDLLFKAPFGFFQSFFYIFFLAPDLVFSIGGYGSFSTVFSAWLLQTPIFIHEPDVVPGLTNRFMSKFVQKVFVSFPISQTEYFSAAKMIPTGNPIRKEILEGSREEAKRLFALSGEKPVILVLGGSLGAQKINDLILAILPEILTKFELIHQTGFKNFEGVKSEAKVVISKELEKYYHPTPFLKEIELKQAYKASYLVVSRAGSGTIFEIAACGKPSILIPLLTAAQNHQVKNAYAYAQSGASLVIEEANLTPYFFLEKLKYLFFYSTELEKMTLKTREFAKPKAARTIAEYITEHLKE